MAAHHIGRSEMEVVVHHRQGRVAQDVLQRQHVAAGAQVGHPEGVAKAMRVDVRHVGPRRQSLEHASQGVARQRSTLARQKHPIRVGIRVIRPGARQLQIPIHHGPRALAQRHGAVAGALAAAHAHLAGGQVQIRHAQAAELGGAQTGIEQHAEDGQVTQAQRRARGSQASSRRCWSSAAMGSTSRVGSRPGRNSLQRMGVRRTPRRPASRRTPAARGISR